MDRWIDGSMVPWFDGLMVVGSIDWRTCRRQRELESEDFVIIGGRPTPFEIS